MWLTPDENRGVSGSISLSPPPVESGGGGGGEDEEEMEHTGGGGGRSTRDIDVDRTFAIPVKVFKKINYIFHFDILGKYSSFIIIFHVTFT